MQGHFAKADVAPKRTLKEFRLEDCDALNIGDILKADVFAEGDIVDVHGVSKGKASQEPLNAHNNHSLKKPMVLDPFTVMRDLWRGFRSVQNPERKKMPGHLGAENRHRPESGCR